MTIGELAKRVGVAPSKLRFLEDAGLIKSVRLSNGYRSYSEAAVGHTKDILQAQSFGFTLAEISAAFIASGGNKLRCDLAIKAMERKLLDLEEHIKRVHVLRGRILSSIRELQSRKLAAESQTGRARVVVTGGSGKRDLGKPSQLRRQLEI